MLVYDGNSKYLIKSEISVPSVAVPLVYNLIVLLL